MPTYSTLIAYSVRCYGHIEIEAASPAEAAEKVRAEAQEITTGKAPHEATPIWDQCHDVDHSTAEDYTIVSMDGDDGTDLGEIALCRDHRLDLVVTQEELAADVLDLVSDQLGDDAPDDGTGKAFQTDGEALNYLITEAANSLAETRQRMEFDDRAEYTDEDRAAMDQVISEISELIPRVTLVGTAPAYLPSAPSRNGDGGSGINGNSHRIADVEMSPEPRDTDDADDQPDRETDGAKH